MSIIHNGVTIGRVFYNGVELDAVYQNGVKVFEKVVAPTWVTVSTDSFYVTHGNTVRGFYMPVAASGTPTQFKNVTTVDKRVYVLTYGAGFRQTYGLTEVYAWYTVPAGGTVTLSSKNFGQNVQLGTVQNLQ